MWRAGGAGEVYAYIPTGSGSGQEIGLGNWHFSADGKWHYIEQAIQRSTGNLTVWYDGVQVLNSPGILATPSGSAGVANIPFAGVLFSTFFGGHDTSWSPSADVNSYWADFKIDTKHIGQ
jgi:hypothetical protein